jgi:hypothetical protein
LIVKELSLPTEGVPRCLCWSADAKAFFYLEPEKGRVRRIAFPGLSEERVLEVGRRCSWLALSAKGLLVTVAESEEVWLVEPATLAVQAVYHIPGVARVVSAPTLSAAIAVNAKGDEASTFAAGTGAPGRAYPARGLGPTAGFDLAAVTPDGKYLFTLGSDKQLCRFKIIGAELALEQSGPAIAPRAHGIDISPDSKYLCVPANGGNLPDRPEHPKVGLHATYVYAVTDLKKPAFVLAQGAHPRAVGFDLRAKQIYAQNDKHQLIVFTPTGQRRQEYGLAESNPQVVQLLVHPEGRRVIVLTTRKVYVVELPGM